MQGKQPAPKAKLSAYLMSLQKVLPYSQTINVASTTVFGFFRGSVLLHENSAEFPKLENYNRIVLFINLHN